MLVRFYGCSSLGMRIAGECDFRKRPSAKPGESVGWSTGRPRGASVHPVDLRIEHPCPRRHAPRWARLDAVRQPPPHADQHPRRRGRADAAEVADIGLKDGPAGQDRLRNGMVCPG